jgi:hypothetical protein
MWQVKSGPLLPVFDKIADAVFFSGFFLLQYFQKIKAR